ncbi:siderophore ABC transporter substrate-binding protein [Demequina zhanjiangensis]|uniref:ABC transporter substrate-binding protein n=1 Tax=Demequina zhanjiangensis TaxID=3051659 RepID=A0ABT8FZ17_9MICO|nr:ABC transporter substrate-binding protein [Demequina sp. SYSU T00b26]MDN4472130.1 ABC transporter substrate-binding protein [Demequina sp. SYSU T00b26]
MHTSRLARSVALVAVASAALAACSSADADTAADATSAAAEAAQVTIATATGDVTLDADPQRVVVFEHGILDIIDTLGHGDSVVAIPHHALPSYLNGYTESTANGGTLFEPDYEAINAAEPDLIIVGGRSASTFDQMEEIAPTIDLSYDWGSEGYSTSLERNALAIGALFGEEDAAQTAVDELTAQGDAIAADAGNAGAGLVVLTTGGQVSAFGPSDEGRFDFAYGVLGLEAATDQGTIDEHGDSISYEFLADLDPSWLIVIDRDAAIGEEGESAQQLLDNDLVNGTTAAQEGRIVYVTPENWYLSMGGLTAMSTVYDEVATLVG